MDMDVFGNSNGLREVCYAEHVSKHTLKVQYGLQSMCKQTCKHLYVRMYLFRLYYSLLS